MSTFHDSVFPLLEKFPTEITEYENQFGILEFSSSYIAEKENVQK